MTEFRGERRGAGRRFAVVAARFNPTITGALLEGAVACLRGAGVPDGDIDVAHVPGSMELPVVAHRLAASGRYAGVICLGAVIRGETSHHEVVSVASASALHEVALRTGVPVTHGIVAADDLETAAARAGGSAGNRGWDAAAAALEVADLLDGLPVPGQARG